MGADVLDAAQDLLAQGDAGAALDLLPGHAALCLRPALDALEEGPAVVFRAGFARRIYIIQMDVRFHIGRKRQLPAEVHPLGLRIPGAQAGSDLRKGAVLHQKVGDAGGALELRV